MTEENYIFAFFPYLKTTESVHYKGVIVRDADNLENLPLDAISHIEKLRSMFFLRDHLRIKKMSFAFTKITNEGDASDFNEKLIEFQNIACFCYSTPHQVFSDPFLLYEHSSLFLFRPKPIYEGLIRNENNVEILQETQRLPINDRNEVDGYEGLLNNLSHFWVTEGSHIFPPTVNLNLNTSQDLGDDFNHKFLQSEIYKPVITYFSRNTKNTDFKNRVLTALIWHNRSLRNGIEESEALVNLAIAFESLLDLDRSDRLTARFKEAVGLLVGDINRLDSWLTQFYDARSEIVHKGRASRLMFVPGNNPKMYKKPAMEYRSLVSYGRQIFQICTITIITGGQLAQKINLPSLLITNQERFERICQVLTEKGKTPVERLLNIEQDVADIEKYYFVSENGLSIDLLVGAAKLITKQFLESELNDSPEITALMERFLSVDKGNHYEALGLINEIENKLKRELKSKTRLQFTIHTIVTIVFENIWLYTFGHFYFLGREMKKNDI